MTAARRSPAAAPAVPPSGQLRAVITARGLTAHAVARLADVAPSVVSRFLAGKRGLTLDTFDRIAAGLGLALVELPRRPTPAAGPRGK